MQETMKIEIKHKILAVGLLATLGFGAYVHAQTEGNSCDPAVRNCPKVEKESVTMDNSKTTAPAAEITAVKADIKAEDYPVNPVPLRPKSTTKPVMGTESALQADAKQEAQAQAAQDPEALRKAAQNPIASLISVPFQNNSNFAVGPNNDRVQNVLIVQPVIPVAITPSVNMIMRLVTPIVYQPNTAPPTPATPSGAFGFGDFNPSFFFSPSKAGKIIWGVGPTFIFPTASSRTLGQGKFQAGPTFVWLVQPGKWTVGSLFNNTWSFAGKSDRPSTNQGIFQYFINYNLKKGYYLTWQPTITFNWKAEGAGRWLVPFGGGVGRIMKVGPQPMNISVQAYANPIRQPNTSPFTLRFSVALLYPKK